MNIKIRRETVNDYQKTEEITRVAFWNLYKPGCDEHYLVHLMRNHKDFIPELSFVIELDDKVVGSIFYTHSHILLKNGSKLKTITFGPVSILPELHRNGLGRALITHSIEEAKNLGFKAIVIAGYPYHYKTYGFIGSKKYGIAMPDGNFYSGIQALPLVDSALDNIEGIIIFSEIYEADYSGADEYDKNFQSMEKGFQESQNQFAKAVIEIDEKIYT